MKRIGVFGFFALAFSVILVLLLILYVPEQKARNEETERRAKQVATLMAPAPAPADTTPGSTTSPIPTTPTSTPISTPLPAQHDCVGILSVSDPGRLTPSQDFTCVVLIDHASSPDVACGWSSDSTAPSNGGRWEGASCSDSTCSFGIRAPSVPGEYYLLGYDMSSDCGLWTGLRIKMEVIAP